MVPSHTETAADVLTYNISASVHISHQQKKAIGLGTHQKVPCFSDDLKEGSTESLQGFLNSSFSPCWQFPLNGSERRSSIYIFNAIIKILSCYSTIVYHVFPSHLACVITHCISRLSHKTDGPTGSPTFNMLLYKCSAIIKWSLPGSIRDYVLCRWRPSPMLHSWAG